MHSPAVGPSVHGAGVLVGTSIHSLDMEDMVVTDETEILLADDDSTGPGVRNEHSGIVLK